MRKLIIVCKFLIISLGVYSQNFSWVKTIGDVGAPHITDLKQDTIGNIYSAGTSQGFYDINPNYQVNYQGIFGSFITKTDEQGNLIWERHINNMGGWANSSSGIINDLTKIAVCKNGNVYATATFSGSAEFGELTGNINDNITLPTYWYATFIFKFNSAGNLIWYKKIDPVVISDLEIDISETSIYLSGYYSYANVDFDPGVGVSSMTCSGQTDAFLLKLDTAGIFNWVNSIGGADIEQANNIAVDGGNNIYVTGSFSSQLLNLTSNTGVQQNVFSYSPNNQFVLKFDKNGILVWSKSNSIGSASIFSNKKQHLYLSSSFTGLASIDTYSYSSIPGTGNFIVSRIDTLGNIKWIKNIGNYSTGTYLACNKLDIDNEGNSYAIGGFQGVVDFDPNASVVNYSASSAIGESSAFILKLDTVGNHIWSKKLGTDRNTTLTTILANNKGDVFSTGHFGDSIVFNENFPNKYTHIYSSANNENLFTIKYSCAPLVILPPTVTCLDSSLVISASGVNTFSWSNGATTPSININVNTNTVITVKGSTSASCVNTQQFDIIVDSLCNGIWPGDVNSDGIADNTDILELGLHYTQTGAARTTTNNAWQSFYSTNWTGTITNGKNVNHSDCNGDGTINNDDTLAIYNNYGLTHTLKLNQVQSTNPALNIIPDQSSVYGGNWGTISVYLGDATNTMNNVNGVAYTLNYNNSLIEQDSVYLTYQNSFIDAGQNLHFRKTNFITGALYTASTHTNNTNVSGFGKIATLHYKIRSDVTTATPLSLAVTQAVVSNASGSITPITSGASTIIAIGASVGIKDYATNSNFLMFPNPTSEMLNVKLEMLNGSAQINIYNALGALVLKENINSKQTTINTSNFAKGMYVVELQSNNQVLHRAKLIKE